MLIIIFCALTSCVDNEKESLITQLSMCKRTLESKEYLLMRSGGVRFDGKPPENIVSHATHGELALEMCQDMATRGNEGNKTSTVQIHWWCQRGKE